MSTAAPTTRQHATLIGSMGCNQILAWGSTFYLLMAGILGIGALLAFAKLRAFTPSLA